MEPHVQYTRTSDGANIAYAVLGDGPTLVCTPWSWQSIRYELEESYGGAFYQALSEGYQVVLYDRRGIGLSDRERRDFTIEADLRDLEAIVDRLRLKRFALLGAFHLGPTALVYAARNPEKVSRLILYGTYASGQQLTSDERKTSLTSMMRSFWGLAARTLADLTVPGGNEAMREHVAHVYHQSVAGDVAANLLALAYRTEVTEQLSDVTCPALVLHRQGARAVPFRLGQDLAAHMPHGRLVPLEGTIYWPWFGDSESVIRAITEFLGGRPRQRRPRSQRTPEGPLTIVFTDLDDAAALAHRLGDAEAQNVRRIHNRIVRDALRANGGFEIKHTGDGIMASFSSAARALACAATVQRMVSARGDDRLRVQIGVNAGEPIAEEEDLFGTSVDLAARICDRAEPGQILASNVVRELVAGKGFLFADRGAVVPKGFDEPVRLYEVRWRESSTATAGRRTARRRRRSARR